MVLKSGAACAPEFAGEDLGLVRPAKIPLNRELGLVWAPPATSAARSEAGDGMEVFMGGFHPWNKAAPSWSVMLKEKISWAWLPWWI
jgi:hypothetical protein